MTRRAYYLKQVGKGASAAKAPANAVEEDVEDNSDSEVGGGASTVSGPIPAAGLAWISRMDQSIDEQLEWCKASPDYGALRELLGRPINTSGKDWYSRSCYSPDCMSKWVKWH